MTKHLTPGLRAVVIATAVGLGLVAVADVTEARPRARVNVWVGSPFWWGIPFGYGYGYPYVVERPVIVHQPMEPVFVPSATQQNHSWYYPYVTSCPSAWQEVPATPEPAAPAANAAPEAPAAASTTPAPARRSPAAPVPPARSN